MNQTNITSSLQPKVQTPERLWFWMAAVLLGTSLGGLAFHLHTRTTPRPSAAMPDPFVFGFVGLAAVMAWREKGLVRSALALFGAGLFVLVLRPVGLVGWSAWGTQTAALWISGMLLIIHLRRSMRVRVGSIAAAVLFVLVLSYGTQRLGYDMWLRANGQKSVMSP